MLRLSGGLAKGIADAKVIVPSDENLELSEVFPLKPRVGQNVAVYAPPTASNFFLRNFYLPDPLNCIFSSKFCPDF